MLVGLLKVMRKKQSLVLCVVAMVAIFASCAPAPTAAPSPQAPVTPAAKPTPSVTPASQPSPTQTPTPVKPIELKFSNYMSPTHTVTQQVLIPFVAEIEKKTGGRVKVTMYHSETLGKAADQPDLVRKGTADIGYVVPSLTPGRFPLLSLPELPFAIPTAASGTEAVWRMYKEGYFKTELGEFETLMLVMASPKGIMTKKPAATLADLKGLKIRIPGGPAGKAMEAVGASPVSLASSDVYLALDRGTIDGADAAYTTLLSLKLQEVAKYFFDVRLSASVVFIIMNKDSWGKLPADIQNIFRGLGEEVVRWWVVSYDIEDFAGRGDITKAGVEVRSLSVADKAKWTELSGPVWNETIAAVDQKGLPGKATFDAFLKLLAKLGVR